MFKINLFLCVYTRMCSWFREFLQTMFGEIILLTYSFLLSFLLLCLWNIFRCSFEEYDCCLHVFLYSYVLEIQEYLDYHNLFATKFTATSWINTNACVIGSHFQGISILFPFYVWGDKNIFMFYLCMRSICIYLYFLW